MAVRDLLVNSRASIPTYLHIAVTAAAHQRPDNTVNTLASPVIRVSNREQAHSSASGCR